jgi:hypothetical protein
LDIDDQEIEKAAEDVNGFYGEVFDKLSLEIIEGIEEGFKEGVKTGVRNGLLQIIGLSFLGSKKQEASSIEDLLKNSFAKGLTKTAGTMTERNVCPILKTWLENRCDEAVEILVTKGMIKTAKNTSDLARFLKVEEKADKEYSEMSDQAKKVLTSSFIVHSFYQGVQSTLWSCTKDGIKSCQKRIAEMNDHKETS